MTLRAQCKAILLLSAIALTPHANAQTKTCTATEADKPAIARTLEKMFEAAMNNDIAAFDALVTPNFYTYDGGMRFDGDAILKLIIDRQKQGFKYLWTVPSPTIEIDCNTAWIAYVNKGSLTTPEGAKQDRTWLESAILTKQDSRWLIRFFHSTPVPTH